MVNRRDFLKTSALVPLMNWDMAPTVPQHRPTDLEEAIAAYHWPHAKAGLGAQLLRLSRNLVSEHSYTLSSIMVHRIDEKEFPNAFTLWCNVTGKWSGLEEKRAIKKDSWTREVVEELNKEGYIRTGLTGDDVEVWLTTVPNHMNSYCPIFEAGQSAWVFYNWKEWEHEINYYKYDFPDRRGI